MEDQRRCYMKARANSNEQNHETILEIRASWMYTGRSEDARVLFFVIDMYRVSAYDHCHFSMVNNYADDNMRDLCSRKMCQQHFPNDPSPTHQVTQGVCKKCKRSMCGSLEKSFNCQVAFELPANAGLAISVVT